MKNHEQDRSWNQICGLFVFPLYIRARRPSFTLESMSKAAMSFLVKS
jgi:hypothetical protein